MHYSFETDMWKLPSPSIVPIQPYSPTLENGQDVVDLHVVLGCDRLMYRFWYDSTSQFAVFARLLTEDVQLKTGLS